MRPERAHPRQPRQQEFQMPIKVHYNGCDGYRATRSFMTIKGARRYAVERVGEHPEFGSSYAVSGDGVGTIRVSGCTLRELFAKPATAPAPVLELAWGSTVEDYHASEDAADNADAFANS